jgi:hypothetical protein
MALLTQLQDAIINDRLPNTDVPFSAGSEKTEEQLEIDLELLGKAAIELAIGKKVFYTSSW